MSDQFTFDVCQPVTIGFPYDDGNGGAQSPTQHAGFVYDWESAPMPPVPDRPFEVQNEVYELMILNALYQAVFPIKQKLTFNTIVFADNHAEIIWSSPSQSSLA